MLEILFSDKYFIKQDSDGITRPYINSMKLMNVAKKYYNCDKIDGIPLQKWGEMELLDLTGKKEYY